MASCGGLLRDDSGRFIQAFVANLGRCPISMAEIWGYFHALNLAWKMGYRKVVLELDSIAAIQLIHNCNDLRHPYACVV